MADVIMTPEFRVSFPNVFKPRKNDQGENRYGLAMLFKKGENLDKFIAAVEAAAKEKWGNKIPKNLKRPFRNQGDKELEGYVEGCVFINATSVSKPGLVDRDREDILDETEFYPGCYARATVIFKAYDGKQNVVACHVNNIQKLRDGEPLNGRTRAQDDFADDLPEDEGASDVSKFW